MEADITTGRTRPRRSFAWGLLAGLAAVVVVAAIVHFAGRSGPRRPRLTRDAFDAATRRWEEQGPANYNLDVEVSGNRPGKIHIEVRRGEAVHMVRDGVEPVQQRTWYYWTVPGMLDTIGLELEKVDDPARGFGAPADTSVVLWASFDERLGYPTSYTRSVSGQSQDMSWEITRFESLPDQAKPSGDETEAKH